MLLPFLLSVFLAFHFLNSSNSLSANILNPQNIVDIQSSIDHVNDFVREHLGMDAKVSFVFKELEYGLRDPADAQLEGRPVFHQGGDVLANPAGYFRRLGQGDFNEWHVYRHHVVNVVNVKHTVA